MSTSNGAVPDLDLDAIIDAAQPAERTIALCLRGDLVARFEELERELEVAQEARGDSLASGGHAREIADQMDALRAEMRAATVTVVMRAMPRKKYQTLHDQHPPRRDEEGNVLAEDRAAGVNMDTFWEPLIRACWVSPVVTPARMKRLLDEVLSNKQYDDLASLAYLVNLGDVDIPFSPAASRLIQPSGSE